MLFVKETKKVAVSVIFPVFLVAIIVFASSQDILNFSYEKITPPRQGQELGRRKREVPELVMPAAFNALCDEFAENSYVAYPLGHYKRVKLNEKRQGQMAEILAHLSGTRAEDRRSFGGSPATWERIELKEGISYEEFKEYMERADGLIGGGSKYSGDRLAEFSYVPVTFEEAQEEYRLIAEVDRFTGAYARLFCDYFGIILSVLPVFFAVALSLKDRKAGMSELIYTRKTSSGRLILTRYFAILVSVMLPVIILAHVSGFSVWKMYPGQALDYFSPLKYTAGWLLPSAMISVAVGMFFTELTGTPVAIAIQGIWWFVDLNMGTTRMEGRQTLFQLIPRHNTLRNTQAYIDHFHRLAGNRMLCVGAALALVLMTVAVYEQKRRGNINGSGKITKFSAGGADRKSKPAA